MFSLTKANKQNPTPLLSFQFARVDSKDEITKKNSSCIVARWGAVVGRRLGAEIRKERREEGAKERLYRFRSRATERFLRRVAGP